MPVNCSVCEVVCDTEFQLRQHETGRKHRNNCLKHQISNDSGVVDTPRTISLPKQVTPVKPTSPSHHVSPLLPLSSTSVIPTVPHLKDFYCDVCSVQMNSNDQFQLHLLGQKHRRKMTKCAESRPLSSQTILEPQHNDSVADTTGQASLFSCDIMDLTVAREDPFLRVFIRSCRECLGPIWPDVSFTQGEADTLVVAAEFRDDCVLLLDDVADAWFRVGIHLLTGLLIANQNSKYKSTSAIWIAPVLSQCPDLGLFSAFRFPSSTLKDRSNLELDVCCPPFVDYSFACDLYLTDLENFCSSLKDQLFIQDKVCCIFLQQADRLARSSKLTDILSRYIKKFPVKNRARIICLTNSSFSVDSLFIKFRVIHFDPPPTNQYF